MFLKDGAQEELLTLMTHVEAVYQFYDVMNQTHVKTQRGEPQLFDQQREAQ